MIDFKGKSCEVLIPLSKSVVFTNHTFHLIVSQARPGRLLEHIKNHKIGCHEYWHSSA